MESVESEGTGYKLKEKSFTARNRDVSEGINSECFFGRHKVGY
jgi:hypothetical protein